MSAKELAEKMGVEYQSPIVRKNKSVATNKVINTVGLFGDIIEGLAKVLTPIVSLFGAKYTMPVVAVSQIAEQFGKLNDEDLDTLQNNVIGLSKIIDIMQDDLENAENNNNVIDVEHVRSWIIELKSINELRKLNNKILD